jgi:16S rRNA (cytosine967-C5)-methyltransferase
MTSRFEPNARSIAAHVIERATRDGSFAAAVLDAAVDRFPELDPRERALATELTYGALRVGPYLESRLAKHQSHGAQRLEETVRAHLLVAAYQLLFLERVPAFAAVSESVRLVTAVRGKRVGAFANAVLRKLAAEPTGDKRAALSDAIRASVAPSLWRSLVLSLGEERAAAFVTQSATPPIGLRVRYGDDRSAWVERLAREVPRASFAAGAVSPLAILMRGGGDPQNLPFFRDGSLTIHEEGAQVIALALGASPGENVLDACAGRGNKTALLVEMVGPKGAVDAADRHPAKLVRLTAELERMNVRARATFAVDWSVGPGDVKADYDRVLVDAPCSGTGTIRRRPDLASRWDAKSLPELSRLQVQILLAAAARAKPGGMIVYAVCSVLREECEDVVNAAVASDPSLTPVPLDSAAVPALEGRTTVRLMPEEHGTDGYFLAAFRRRG